MSPGAHTVDRDDLRCLLWCDDPFGEQWQLPRTRPANGALAMLGWIVEPPSVEAGVPRSVARIVADALSGELIVSFFEGRTTSGGPLRRWLAGSKDVAPVRHTTDAHEIAGLFDAPHFDWSARAQAAFLSEPASPQPELTLADLDTALMGNAYDRLQAGGIVGLLLPGVDGAVIGVYSFGSEFGQRLRARLRAACEGNGVRWREVSEDAFARALAQHPDE